MTCPSTSKTRDWLSLPKNHATGWRSSMSMTAEEGKCLLTFASRTQGSARKVSSAACKSPKMMDLPFTCAVAFAKTSGDKYFAPCTVTVRTPNKGEFKTGTAMATTSTGTNTYSTTRKRRFPSSRRTSMRRSRNRRCGCPSSARSNG